MKIAFLLFITSMYLTSTGDISMSGIKINDKKKSLDALKLEVVASEENMIKYRTENGNDFSVTLEKGKVVFMENDWLQDSSATQPLFSDFKFGQTTLRDIRNKFENNGFTYKNMLFFQSETHVVLFNCFGFESENNEVLVTITKVGLGEEVTEENLADKCKLDALIIADEAYLDKMWGKDKVYDPNYKKIQF